MGLQVTARLVFVTLFLSSVSTTVFADDEDLPGTKAKESEASEEVPSGETDELLKQLTLAMASEAIDEHTFEIRDTEGKIGKRKKIHLRLGNVIPLERGAGASDEEHEAQRNRTRTTLTNLVGKQMVWYQAAPEEHQPPVREDDKVKVVMADVWLIDGRHVNTLMMKQGHLAENKVYHNENARNILSAEADEKKKESYKLLDEALRESDVVKRKAVEEAAALKRAEAQNKSEPIGMIGWIALALLALLVFGSLTNFGRATNKKTNPNRKRGFFEKAWLKIKGA